MNQSDDEDLDDLKDNDFGTGKMLGDTENK